MKKPSDEQLREELRQRIIGLGERSLKKSYYPELQKQIRELERTNAELQHEIQQRKIAEEMREKLEFQLRQAQKMEAIGSLAGGIAHDFNNILSAIIGYTELAAIHVRQCSGNAECMAIKDLNGVLRSADRAKQLVRQILSFSRQRTADMVPIAMEDLLKDTLRMLRALIPTTIAIDHDIRTRESMILADPTQITQVIMNLGTNAYHAMREKGGTLLFDLSQTVIEDDDRIFADLKLAPGPYLILRVSDTGCGMDRVTLGKIFDPYFSTRSEQGGTGLGLSVVHGIISHHKGHISVYSEPGRGTTFRLYLPQLQTLQEGKEPGHLAGTLQRGHERLLIVEDESALLEVMQRILEDLGYTVTAAKTPLAALHHFATNPEGVDLLITDMNMPEMNGAELIGKIRAIRQDIPVILCTGFSEIMNGNSTKALGAARHIMKPVTQRELNETIRGLLDGRSLTAG